MVSIDREEKIDRRLQLKSFYQALTLHTTLGDLSIELFCEQTPRTCENFLALAASGYYNGCLFHRNIKGFMVQTGLSECMAFCMNASLDTCPANVPILHHQGIPLGPGREGVASITRPMGNFQTRSLIA